MTLASNEFYLLYSTGKMKVSGTSEGFHRYNQTNNNGMKKIKKAPLKKIKIDRGMNPYDGSRRRLSSAEHKSKKHYSRKSKHKGGAFSVIAA